MEVKPGYKQTEGGVIPDEWRLLPFDAVFQKATAKNHQIQTKEYQESGTYPVVDQGQAPIVGYSDREDKVYHVPDSGVVIFGDHTCIVKFVRYDFVVGADGTQILTAKAGQDAEFHAYILMNRRVEPTGYNRHFKFLKERTFQAPPFPEQRAIAAALSDVDALLAGQDALIAKKRDLKQAAMQQLLTGQTRLPGFHGEWEVKRTGEVTSCVAGGTPSTFVPSYWGGSIKWMSSGELHLKRVEDVAARITEDGLRNSAATILPKKCVLVGLAGQGKTRGTVAINMAELSTNQSIAAVLPSPAFVPEYLYYNLDRRYEELRDLSSGGGGRGGLNLKLIGSIAVPLPSIAEQTSIATVLSDMDAELTALEARRDKTRNLKQAMMQELLTGKTRFVPAGAAHA